MGIRSLQGLLKVSKFNYATTIDGYSALMGYRSEIDIKNGVMKAIPVHDWCADAADAARYVAEARLLGKIKDTKMVDEQKEDEREFWRKKAVVQSKGFKNKEWWK